MIVRVGQTFLPEIWQATTAVLLFTGIACVFVRNSRRSSRLACRNVRRDARGGCAGLATLRLSAGFHEERHRRVVVLASSWIGSIERRSSCSLIEATQNPSRSPPDNARHVVRWLSSLFILAISGKDLGRSAVLGWFWKPNVHAESAYNSSRKIERQATPDGRTMATCRQGPGVAGRWRCSQLVVVGVLSKGPPDDRQAPCSPHWQVESVVHPVGSGSNAVDETFVHHAWEGGRPLSRSCRGGGFTTAGRSCRRLTWLTVEGVGVQHCEFSCSTKCSGGRSSSPASAPACMRAPCRFDWVCGAGVVLLLVPFYEDGFPDARGGRRIVRLETAARRDDHCPG